MIEVRILACKNRDYKPLQEWLEKHSIQVKVFEDTTDNYKLPVGNPDRLKGSIMNCRRLLADEDVPEDNQGYIVMVEDDIKPIENLEPTLREILKAIPQRSIVFGMVMEFKGGEDVVGNWKAKGEPNVIELGRELTTQLTIVPRLFGRLIETEAKSQGGFIKHRGKTAPLDTMINNVAKTYNFKKYAIMPNLVEHDVIAKPVLNQDRSNKARHSVMFDGDYDYSKVNWKEEFMRYENL